LAEPTIRKICDLESSDLTHVFGASRLCSKPQLFFSCSSPDADCVFKQINIYLHGPLKINHRTLPTLPSPVQGSAVLDFLRVGLQPVSSYLVYSTWRNCICALNYGRDFTSPTPHVSLQQLWM